MSGTMIDEAGPAVVYSGSWVAHSGWSSAYQGTLHESNTLNDRATLTFQGTSVLVNSGQQGIGWRVRSSYTIDGSSSTVYSNDSYQSTTVAYTSPTLPNGQHTLTVINLDNRAVYLFLDSFVVFTADDSPSASSPSSSTTTLTGASTPVSVSSNSSVAGSGTTTSTTTPGGLPPTLTTGSSASNGRQDGSTLIPSPSTRSSEPNQIPLIVGPIFGAIVICSIIYGFLLLKRRRTQKKSEESSRITPASYNPGPIQPQISLPVGEKPSSFNRNANEPPPYAETSQPSSHSSTPIRQPAKFRT